MRYIVLVVLVLLKCFAAVTAYTDPDCANHDHPDYGCVGKCVSSSTCPGDKYITGLCPSQPNDVTCCFTADSDRKCAEYRHWSYGQVGHCIATSECPNNAYISNLCPTKSNGIKCCFSKPTDTCSASGGSCSATASSLACQILSHSRITLLDNNKYLNSAGADDGADSKSNIRDTCAGQTARRSSYCCSSGCAPGGSVCLSTNVLRYLLDLANSGHSIQVNALAGACHSSTSRHYRGTAVDLQVARGSKSYEDWMDKCAASGAVENFGPGNPGHDTHTHCAFAR